MVHGRKWSWVAVGLTLAAVAIFVWPIFDHPGALINDDPYRYHDYLQQASYDFLFRQAVLEHHQFPLRTHMLGGGYPLIANPQDTSFSPFALTSLIFGEALGIKINLLLFFLIGAAGMMLLARKGLALPWPGAIFAAAAYCFSSWWASRVEWGFYFKFYFHLVPLLLYFYLKARREWRYLIPAAMILTVIITQLGLGFVVILLFLFCFDLTDYLAKIARDQAPLFLARLALLVVLVSALGAVRILPMAGLISENPRTVGSYEEYETSNHPFPSFYKGAGHFAAALTRYDPTPNYPIHPGWGVLLLACVGAIGMVRKSWPFSALTLLFTWFAFGPYAPVDLWRALFYLPMFSSMHQPYQLTNFFILLGLALLAAFAFSLIDRLQNRKLAACLSLAPLLFLIQPWMANRPVYERTFTQEAPRLSAEPRFFPVKGLNQGRGAPRTLHSHQYFNLLRNVGTIDWDGDVVLEESAVAKHLIDNEDRIFENPEYRGEAFLDLGKGAAEIILLSPNRIQVRVEAAAPDRLVINQNYDRAWQGSDDLSIEPYRGLLSVRIPGAGRRTIELVYRPRLFYATLAISLFSWMFAAGCFVFACRKSSASAGFRK